ncbi:MAG: hypothetical protein LBE02_07700 [Spirochaetaceae bacterium]|jgi:hypothetical protein|nr:hypothetical protein [Spirochaetaceae bacterium]
MPFFRRAKPGFYPRFCSLFPVFFALPFFPLHAQEVLRGEVQIPLEQARGFTVEETRSLNIDEARARALEEAARYYGAMIYGWSFHYEIGERARNIEEHLELVPLGAIAAEDPRLESTNLQVKDFKLYLWSDYRLSGDQQYRLSKWKTGTIRSVQGYGHGSLENKYAALEDAARAALRSMLRGGERNRPKEASGYISLRTFPRYWLDQGQWMAAGRFLVEIQEIIPFAAY